MQGGKTMTTDKPKTKRTFEEILIEKMIETQEKGLYSFIPYYDDESCSTVYYFKTEDSPIYKYIEEILGENEADTYQIAFMDGSLMIYLGLGVSVERFKNIINIEAYLEYYFTPMPTGITLMIPLDKSEQVISNIKELDNMPPYVLCNYEIYKKIFNNQEIVHDKVEEYVYNDSSDTLTLHFPLSVNRGMPRISHSINTYSEDVEINVWAEVGERARITSVVIKNFKKHCAMNIDELKEKTIVLCYTVLKCNFCWSFNLKENLEITNKNICWYEIKDRLR